MAQTKTTRIKAPAQDQVPQNTEECGLHIHEIGLLQRELERLQTVMNDEISQITERYNGLFDPLKLKLSELHKGVQAFCEAHRDELTAGNTKKTASFVTGDVQWRQRPPSVKVRAVDVVLETLERLGLSRFIRTKQEINKEAILAEPDAVKGVAGITIQSGVEDFVVMPFEQDVV